MIKLPEIHIDQPSILTLELNTAGPRTTIIFTIEPKDVGAIDADIRAFVDQRCRLGSGADPGLELVADVYQAYGTWCVDNDKQPTSSIMLTKKLSRLGVTRYRTANARYYRGITVLPSEWWRNKPVTAVTDQVGNRAHPSSPPMTAVTDQVGNRAHPSSPPMTAVTDSWDLTTLGDDR